MNKLFKKLLALFLVMGSIHAQDESDQRDEVIGKTYFSARSQGSNWARWLAGQAHHTHLCDTDGCVNGSLSITPNYQQNYDSPSVGRFLFFNGRDMMKFGTAGGSDVDVFSRNFFLNDQFEATVLARPRKQDFIVDLNFYLGLDEWVKGLYFRIDAPAVWTKWDVRLEERDVVVGDFIAAGALGNGADTASPLDSVLDAWAGEKFNNTNFSALKQPLQFGKIRKGGKSEGGVADITMLLGYDFICNDCAHLGVNAALIAPTGDRPNGEYLFEAVIGNGRHFEFGAGFSGHYELWNNGCDQSFGIFFAGNIYHVFKSSQRRLFDLKDNGIGSRYLLLKKFDSNGAPLDEISFGPNVLNFEVKVSNKIHGDGAIMFDYQYCGFTFDIGYNVWGRTKDQIEFKETIAENTWAVQGLTDSDADNSASQTKISGMDTTLDPATVFIRQSDIDVNSAIHPSAISHSVFTHFAYTWENCDYLPYIGAGGQVEFSGNDNRAFDMWGVWVKGGFTFS